MKTIDFISLGCSKNLVDSENLMGMFEANGFHVTHDSDDPQGEVVVVNTGGFIADAKDESDLRDRGYLYAMDMFAPENFVLGKKSVTFVYNHYEIASYDKGIIELELSYDDLEELIGLEY